LSFLLANFFVLSGVEKAKEVPTFSGNDIINKIEAEGQKNKNQLS